MADDELDEDVEELLDELNEYDDLESMLDDLDEEIELAEFEEGDAGAIDEKLVD